MPCKRLCRSLSACHRRLFHGQLEFLTSLSNHLDHVFLTRVQHLRPGHGCFLVAMVTSLSERLRDAALRCCEDEGIEESEASAREFLELLEGPLYDLELRKASAGNWLAQCEQRLQQAVELLDPSSSSGLNLCEKIGLELPQVAVKFVSLSQACQDHCLSIIEDFAENCSPRHMFGAFMKA